MSEPEPLLTVGHGVAEQDAFALRLTAAEVAAVVDVRAHPGSRRAPQFGRAALERWLPHLGIAYRWVPELGGHRVPCAHSPNRALREPAFRGYADHMATPEFGSAINEVLRRATGKRTAVMCAEGDWHHCHRRLLADSVLLLHHTPVVHLVPDGTLADHDPTTGVRVDGHELRYDGGEPSLF